MQLHAVRAGRGIPRRADTANSSGAAQSKSCPARPANFQVAIQVLSLAALTLDQTGAVESTMMA